MRGSKDPAALARRDGEGATQQVPASRLRDREIQLLKLVARGDEHQDIAEELSISENTVKNRVRNILQNLQIRSRLEAVLVGGPGRSSSSSADGKPWQIGLVQATGAGVKAPATLGQYRYLQAQMATMVRTCLRLFCVPLHGGLG